MRNSIENLKRKEIQDPSFNEFIKIIKKIELIFDGDLPEDVQDIDSLYSMIIKSVNEKLNSNIANIGEIVLVGEFLSIPLIKLFLSSKGLEFEKDFTLRDLYGVYVEYPQDLTIFSEILRSIRNIFLKVAQHRPDSLKQDKYNFSLSKYIDNPNEYHPKYSYMEVNEIINHCFDQLKKTEPYSQLKKLMGNQYLPYINRILTIEITSAVKLQSNFISRPEDEDQVYLSIRLYELTELQFFINNNGWMYHISICPRIFDKRNLFWNNNNWNC